MMCGICLILATLALENDSMKLLFREEGGFGITGIVNKVAGNATFCASTGDIDFWAVRLALPNEYTSMGGEFKDVGGGKFKEVSLFNRTKCRAQRLERIENGLVFVWEGVDIVPPAGHEIECGMVDVRATVVLPPGNEASRWTIDVDNRSQTYATVRTIYPVFKRLGPPGKCDGLLPRSNLGAGLIKNCGDANPTSRYVKVAARMYPDYQPTMAAFMQAGGGVLTMADDSEGRIKTVVVDAQNTVWFDTLLENAGQLGKAARGPKYAVTLEAFRGDWWEAARRYRREAMKRPWSAKGRILDRKDYLRQLCDVDYWINAHCASQHASNTLFAARKVFPDLTCGLHWHGWTTHGFESNYPEFFPGKPYVKETIAATKKIGQSSLMYVNGRFCDSGAESWPKISDVAVLLPSGDEHVERYANKHRQVQTCPYTSKWQDMMTSVADRLSGEYAASGIFFDQYGAAQPSPCYNRAHGHPLGGGAWWTEGLRKIFERSHAITSSRGTYLVTEGTAETWMDNCDGYLCVTFLSPDDVPFYPAVYSGRTIYFGSPLSDKDTLDDFWAIQARQVIWGVSPGWYERYFVLNDKDGNVRAKRKMLADLCHFRQQHKDQLIYGELVDEARFDVPPEEIEVVLHGRWTFAKKPPKVGRIPSVMGSVWRDGKTGQLVTLLANLTSVKRKVMMRGYQLELKPRELISIVGSR